MSQGNVSSAALWHYEVQGERKTGVSEGELISLIEKGAISYGTAVWKEGFSEWKKLENTDFVNYLNKTSPPPITR